MLMIMDDHQVDQVSRTALQPEIGMVLPGWAHFILMTSGDLGKQTTRNQSLICWVNEMKALCAPKNVFWCDGSDQEYQSLCQLMVKSGTLTPLNEKLRPGSFLARSHPSDV